MRGKFRISIPDNPSMDKQALENNEGWCLINNVTYQNCL